MRLVSIFSQTHLLYIKFLLPMSLNLSLFQEGLFPSLKKELTSISIVKNKGLNPSILHWWTNVELRSFTPHLEGPFENHVSPLEYLKSSCCRNPTPFFKMSFILLQKGVGKFSLRQAKQREGGESALEELSEYSLASVVMGIWCNWSSATSCSGVKFLLFWINIKQFTKVRKID